MTTVCIKLQSFGVAVDKCWMLVQHLEHGQLEEGITAKLPVLGMTPEGPDL